MKSTLLLLLLLIAFGGHAQTSYTWTGSASTDWSNTSNWTPTGTPGTGDNVTVGGGTNILTLTANTTVNNLTMNSGTLRLGGYVLTSTGQVQLLGGTVENGKFIHNSATQTATFYNTTLDCKVQTTGKVASMNASKFKDSLSMSITQGFNGGGNKFYDYTAMAFSGSGQETNFGLYNPDTFFAPVKFSVLSYHNLTLAYYSYGSYFADTVYLNNVSGIGTVIKVGHVSCGSTFAGDIVVNALAGAGNIHFAVGVQHDGRIRIGSQGFLTGKLMLAGYTQLDDHLIDLDGMHANATAVFGPNLTVEGEVRSTTAKGEIKSGCTFKKAVNITGLTEWNGARFKDVARLHSTAHTGGNVFEDSLFVSGGGFAMGYPTRDSCFAPASFSLTASGNLQLACSMGNYFADKVTLHHLSGNAANYIYIGSAGITSGGHFLDTIYMNVAAGGGGIIFDQGTMVHDGILAVGADGFNAGTLQLKNYKQTTAGLIDFSSMHSAASVALSHATDITASIKRTSGPSVSILNSILRGTTELVAPRISVVTSRFLGTTLLEKTGATADANYGNGFYAATTIRNTSSTDAELRFSWLSASPDTFYSPLVLDNRTTSVLHSTGIYKGNITFLGDSAAQFQLAYGNTLRSVINGTADQILSVAPHLDVQFFGLDVNKASGKVTLSGTVDVQEDLALQKGIVHSTNANLLLRDNATVTGASDSSHVQGPITKVGNDAFVFPVGRNGAYRPIAISAPSSGSAEFRGEYFTGNSGVLHNHGNREAPLGYISQNEYWALDRLATSNTVSVTLGWDSLTSCAFDTLANLRVTAWSTSGSGQWKNLGNGGTTGNLGVGAVVTGSASNVFDIYALATIDTMYCCNTPVAIAASGSLSHCVGDSSGIVTLTGSGNYSDFVWTADGDVVGTGSPFTISDFRTYVLSRSACAETDTFVADVPDELHLVVTPQLSPEGFSLSCYHATDGMVNVILAGGEPPYSMEYTLNGLPFPPSFAQLGAGVYMLAVTDQTGCTVSRTAELFGPDESFALGYAGPDRTITAGSAVQIGSLPMEGYYYQWTPEIGLSDPTTADPVAYPSDTTVYVLTVWTADSCVSHDTMIVNVLPWEPTVLDSAAVVWIDSMPSHVRGELIVKFKPEMLKMDNVDNVGIQSGALSLFLTDSMIELMRLACYGEEMSLTMNSSFYSEESFSPPPSEMDTWGIRKIFRKMTSADSISISRLGETVRMDDFWTTFMLTLDDELDELSIADSLTPIFPQIQSMDLNQLAELHDVPDDYYFQFQHSLNTNGNFPNAHINMETAWDLEVGSPDRVKVGVFDTGISWSTSDFGDGTFEGSKITGGWDYWDNHHISQTTIDNHGHGTKCAGIIGALRNNGIGIAGIAGGDVENTSNTGAQLFAFKIFYGNTGSFANTGGFATVETAASALVEGSTFNPNTGYGYGLDVLSNSWGITDEASSFDNTTDRLYHNAIRSVFRNHAVAVFSRGNDDTNNEVIPTTKVPDEFLISVGASNQDGLLASFSSYGTKMDLLAPGTDNIVRTTSNNPSSTPVAFDGTSAAAPHVAGVAALLISHHHPDHSDFAYPNGLAPEDVEHILEQYANDIVSPSPYSSGYDEQSGWGKLDAGAALQAIHGPEYTVHHYDMAGVTTSDATTTEITVSLATHIANVAAGLYVADKHVITWEDWVPLSSNETIIPLDVWARFSSSVGFGQGSPIADATFYNLEWNENEIGGMNGVEVTATSTCWFIDRTFPGNLPVQQWIPAHPSQLRAAYSIHQRDLNATSIDEQINHDGIVLYPNPTQGNLTLLLNKEVAVESVEVIDALGKEVSVPSFINTGTVSLDVSSLSSGMYLLRVTTDANDQIIKRFIVQ